MKTSNRNGNASQLSVHSRQCAVNSLNANQKKIDSMRRLCVGSRSKVILVGRDFDDAKETAMKHATDNNLFFVEDGKINEISEGAGTIAYELPTDLDVVYVPIGNGALIIGITKYLKQINPNIKVIGVCSKGAPCMKLSYDLNYIVETDEIDTIADGVGVRVPIPSAVKIINKIVDDVVTVEESNIKYWIYRLKVTENLIVEGAGAITLAAIYDNHINLKDKKVCALICGGNVDHSLLN